MFENEIIRSNALSDIFMKPKNDDNSLPTYGNTTSQLMVTTKSGGPGRDFMALWVRGNVVVSASGMARSVEYFWSYSNLMVIDAKINFFQDPLQGHEEPPVVLSDYNKSIRCNEEFTLEFKVPFDCDHWSFKDLNVLKDSPVCNDVIVVRRVEKESSTFRFKLGGPDEFPGANGTSHPIDQYELMDNPEAKGDDVLSAELQRVMLCKCIEVYRRKENMNGGVPRRFSYVKNGDKISYSSTVTCEVETVRGCELGKACKKGVRWEKMETRKAGERESKKRRKRNAKAVKVRIGESVGV
ncbi:hypothetical protein B0T16DRAFT_454865 [Cercophora newfieldiana]|uniref:Uncharacterized protein n=1 Tax=Cercophora newfieldiana TaxID=92897 RepID=A0AA39YH82_9PEZI|nr:hypothetical protein B0T16DRAFT_454865 [Cercophora newfieldiana]